MDLNWLFDNFTDFVFWKGVIIGAAAGLFLSKYFWNFLMFLLKSAGGHITSIYYRWRKLREQEEKQQRLQGIYWNPSSQLVDSAGNHYCPHCFFEGVPVKLDQVKSISQFPYQTPVYHCRRCNWRSDRTMF